MLKKIKYNNIKIQKSEYYYLQRFYNSESTNNSTGIFLEFISCFETDVVLQITNIYSSKLNYSVDLSYKSLPNSEKPLDELYIYEN